MEKQTMWAVFGPDGLMFSDTLFRKRADLQYVAILFADNKVTWKRLYRMGYRCRKIEVTITKI